MALTTPTSSRPSSKLEKHDNNEIIANTRSGPTTLGDSIFAHFGPTSLAHLVATETNACLFTALYRHSSCITYVKLSTGSTPTSTASLRRPTGLELEDTRYLIKIAKLNPILVRPLFFTSLTTANALLPVPAKSDPEFNRLLQNNAAARLGHHVGEIALLCMSLPLLYRSIWKDVYLSDPPGSIVRYELHWMFEDRQSVFGKVCGRAKASEGGCLTLGDVFQHALFRKEFVWWEGFKVKQSMTEGNQVRLCDVLCELERVSSSVAALAAGSGRYSRLVLEDVVVLSEEEKVELST